MMVMAVQPKAEDPFSPVAVESLQPLLKWTPAPKKDVTYDLAICECTVASVLKPPQRIGTEVYSRQDISGTEHQVEEPLKPNTVYCWSVRVRDGDIVYDWAHYNYSKIYINPFIVVNDYTRNFLFTFRTPQQPEK
jgi:hypothetical protein